MLASRIKTPSRNKYTLEDVINCDYDFTTPISKKEIDVFTESPGFRKLLLWVGRDEFGLVNGFENLSNLEINRNGNEHLPKKLHKQYDLEAYVLRVKLAKILMEAQGGFDFIYNIDSQGGSLSWPYPSQFKNIIENHIMNFECDHLIPVRRGGKNRFDNIVIMTANTNQFLKNSLSLDEFLVKHENNIDMCNRIRQTLINRQILFASDEWGKLIQELLIYG